MHQRPLDMVQEKLELIREHFLPLNGHTIVRFETAEIFHGDGTWSEWPDLPIRLFTDRGRAVSVCWSRFDDLFIVDGYGLPFDVDPETTRWRTNLPDKLDSIIGKKICGTMIGRGEMSIEGKDIPIWTRLVMNLDGTWLEIFNALDENGYEIHDSKPDGEFQMCT